MIPVRLREERKEKTFGEFQSKQERVETGGLAKIVGEKEIQSRGMTTARARNRSEKCINALRKRMYV